MTERTPAELAEEQTDQEHAIAGMYAKERADKIRSVMARTWTTLAPLLAAAYAAHDWETLDYDSWDAYMAGEFGRHLPRFESDSERQQIMWDLSETGMSQRAIAAGTGTSAATVNRALKDEAEAAPATAPNGAGGASTGAATVQDETPEEPTGHAGVDLLPAVQYVVDALDKVWPKGKNVRSLAKKYAHPSTDELERIRVAEEDSVTPIDPELWLIRQALIELDKQVIVPPTFAETPLPGDTARLRQEIEHNRRKSNPDGLWWHDKLITPPARTKGTDGRTYTRPTKRASKPPSPKPVTPEEEEFNAELMRQIQGLHAWIQSHAEVFSIEGSDDETPPGTDLVRDCWAFFSQISVRYPKTWTAARELTDEDDDDTEQSE